MPENVAAKPAPHAGPPACAGRQLGVEGGWTRMPQAATSKRCDALRGTEVFLRPSTGRALTVLAKAAICLIHTMSVMRPKKSCSF